MEAITKQIGIILKKRGFKQTSKEYCSLINGLFYDIHIAENTKNKKIHYTISLLKDSYFYLYIRIHGLDATRNISDKDKLLGQYRIGLIRVYDTVYSINDNLVEQNIIDDILQNLEQITKRFANQDFNNMVLEGAYQPYYKAFALLDSGRIDECLLFCKKRVESGDIGLYKGNNGETFYKDIISRVAHLDNACNNTSELNSSCGVLDDIEWHYESAEAWYCKKHNLLSTQLTSTDIESITMLAGHHMGVFLHWLIENNYLSAFHKNVHYKDLQDILKYREPSVKYLLDNCGGKLTKEDICDKMSDALFEFYTNKNGYLFLYANFIKNVLFAHEYDVIFTETTYNSFKKILNEHM